jgi:hypothetical protein
MVSVREALEQGRRPALERLARQLAGEIDGIADPLTRLATVRAFLATVARLEAMERAAAARQPGAVPAPAVAVDVVDELRGRREARRGRRSG